MSTPQKSRPLVFPSVNEALTAPPPSTVIAPVPTTTANDAVASRMAETKTVGDDRPRRAGAAHWLGAAQVPYGLAGMASVAWVAGVAFSASRLPAHPAVVLVAALALAPVALIWASAFVVAQGWSLMREVRRARSLTDQMVGPAAEAAAGAGTVVDAMRLQIDRASSVAVLAAERLTSLREALDEESSKITRAATLADASARNLVERLSSQRGELNTLAVTLDARAAAVIDATTRQSRTVAEASDLAETQLREAEASLAARTADLAVAAGRATAMARDLGEDLVRQVSCFETSGLAVGEQLRWLETGLTQQRTALAAVAHGLRTEQENFAVSAESRIAQLSRFLKGAGEDIAALGERAVTGAKSTSELIQSLNAATAHARQAADDHASAARSHIEQLNEAAFAAGQRADQVFESRLREALALIAQSSKLVDEAGSATAAKLQEGLNRARAATVEVRGMVDEVAAAAASLPTQTQARAEEVRAAVAKGTDELLAAARATSLETQAIDAAFQQRVKRNYEMLSEAVQLMGVVAQGGSGAPAPRPAAPGPAAVQSPTSVRPALPGDGLSPAQRGRLKLTPTASDEEFKAVFQAAAGEGAQSDPSWSWSQLLTSIDGEAPARDIELGRSLFAEVAGMGIDPAALLSRARIEEIAAAVQTGDRAGSREVVRKLAPAAIRRLSRKLTGDVDFCGRRAAYVERYAKVIETATKRDPQGFQAASLLASDIGRVYLLLDATPGDAR